MNNTRFATAIHILSILAKSNDTWISSEWIAGSINTNPVMVRKELSTLQEAGLVVGRKGKEGGSKLQKPSNKISLAEIYLAVKNSDVLGKKNQHTNPQCPIGKNINKKLAGVFKETDQAVIDVLQHQTLEDFVNRF